MAYLGICRDSLLWRVLEALDIIPEYCIKLSILGNLDILGICHFREGLGFVCQKIPIYNRLTRFTCEIKIEVEIMDCGKTMVGDFSTSIQMV